MGTSTPMTRKAVVAKTAAEPSIRWNQNRKPWLGELSGPDISQACLLSTVSFYLVRDTTAPVFEGHIAGIGYPAIGTNYS